MFKRFREFSRQKLHIGAFNSFCISVGKNIHERKVAFYIALILLFPILGYIPDSNIPLSINKAMLAEWLVLGFIALFFFRNKWLKLWVLWITLCMVTRFNRFSYMEFNTILFYLLFFQLITTRLNKKSINLIYDIIVVIALIQLSMMFLQFFHIYKFYAVKKGLEGHLAGVVGEIDSAGALLAISIPVFVRGRLKVFIPFLILGLYLARSLMPMISVIAGLMVYVSIKLPKWRFRIIGLSVICFLTYILKRENVQSLLTGNGRFDTWREMWKLILEKPIKGWGIGHYRIVFPALDLGILRPENKTAWFTAHNEYLQMIVEEGIVGFFLGMEFIGSTIERYCRKMKDFAFPAFIGIVIALVNCMGHFLIHTVVGLIAIVYFGIITIGGENEENSIISNGLASAVSD